MQRFDFHSASSIENALDYMANAEGVCKIVAGGTDLIPALRKEAIHPDHVLDIMKIEELRGVREIDGKIRIGPATTFTEMVESQILNRTLPLLCRAGSVVGGPQIRNRGTIGGNILTASPCADVLPAVVALDGVVELFSKRSGKRLVPVSEIMDAPYRPRIKTDEMLTGIIVKKAGPGGPVRLHETGEEKSPCHGQDEFIDRSGHDRWRLGSRHKHSPGSRHAGSPEDDRGRRNTQRKGAGRKAPR